MMTLQPHLQGIVKAKPSAAIRSAFLAALAKPFSLNQSVALSKSQSLANKAPLQSISPAPVRSRNTLIKSINESAMDYSAFASSFSSAFGASSFLAGFLAGAFLSCFSSSATAVALSSEAALNSCSLWN